MIKPWRDIAIPHQDVLKGTFQQSEFAADISQVQQGKTPPEYQDARQFFARTFVTEGMALLLDKVIRRLAGLGGDPVIQLQTAFGGGKTHTLIAVRHLAQAEHATAELAGVPTLLDTVGVTALPRARVVVLDGINLSPTTPKAHGDIQARTFWGELAWQLGGADGYAMVQTADESATSPDKDQLIALLTAFSPCVILMDELVAFYRQFQPGQLYPAGTFETNMTFIQALTEGIKSVPRAILLASLPDSHNAGEGRGQVVLAQLEGYFRRLHAIWKPATKDEAFSIVRRRLFERIDDHLAMEDACRDFAELYRANGGELPPETQENYYLERMQQAYPIHPEIFDRLYEDWSTLSNFQRTRGVLQLLAQVVHRLWKDGNADGMILPGALPLHDTGVRNKCLDYLPQGWDPVIDQDIDGEFSRPVLVRHATQSAPRNGVAASTVRDERGHRAVAARARPACLRQGACLRRHPRLRRLGGCAGRLRQGSTPGGAGAGAGGAVPQGQGQSGRTSGQVRPDPAWRAAAAETEPRALPRPRCRFLGAAQGPDTNLFGMGLHRHRRGRHAPQPGSAPDEAGQGRARGVRQGIAARRARHLPLAALARSGRTPVITCTCRG